MDIIVTYGLGESETEIAAFDKALLDAGIGNYNLIFLSSVIPEGARVLVKKYEGKQKEYGYRLYVVMSKYIQTVPGKEAWAGLGWVQKEDGRGLFIEHYGDSQEEVERLIKKSLESMVRNRNEDFEKIRYKIIGTKCRDKPVCALVCAVYKSSGW